MNVHLGEKMESFVENLVKEGSYQSNSEVVRAGLRLLEEQEALRNLRLDELRKEVQRGIDSEARGEIEPWNADQIKREGRKLLAKRRKGK